MLLKPSHLVSVTLLLNEVKTASMLILSSVSMNSWEAFSASCCGTVFQAKALGKNGGVMEKGSVIVEVETNFLI